VPAFRNASTAEKCGTSTTDTSLTETMQSLILKQQTAKLTIFSYLLKYVIIDKKKKITFSNRNHAVQQQIFWQLFP